MVDLDQVAYRPLVGNGVNSDTHFMTNVQSADEDLRKDMVLKEAGVEVSEIDPIGNDPPPPPP